jgi:hypothetical protein
LSAHCVHLVDKIYYKSVYFVNKKIKEIIFLMLRLFINI